jgi:hypothetical protein
MERLVLSTFVCGIRVIHSFIHSFIISFAYRENFCHSYSMLTKKIQILLHNVRRLYEYFRDFKIFSWPRKNRRSLIFASKVTLVVACLVCTALAAILEILIFFSTVNK